MENKSNRESLKDIFDAEIFNNQHLTSEHIIEMMQYITRTDETFNAFHSVCKYLAHMHSRSFFEAIDINVYDVGHLHLHDMKES